MVKIGELVSEPVIVRRSGAVGGLLVSFPEPNDISGSVSRLSFRFSLVSVDFDLLGVDCFTRFGMIVQPTKGKNKVIYEKEGKSLWRGLNSRPPPFFGGLGCGIHPAYQGGAIPG